MQDSRRRDGRLNGDGDGDVESWCGEIGPLFTTRPVYSQSSYLINKTSTVLVTLTFNLV